jgi:hypothetical protein
LISSPQIAKTTTWKTKTKTGKNKNKDAKMHFRGLGGPLKCSISNLSFMLE